MIKKRKLSIFTGMLVALMLTFSVAQASPATVRPEISMQVNGKSYTSITSYLAKFVNLNNGTATFGAMGTSIVEFYVSPSGELSDIQIINSVTHAVDQEVLRALNETSGNWVPGSVNGTPTKMKREVSIVFKPNQNFDLKTIAKKYSDKAKEELVDKGSPDKALKQYDKAITLTPYDQALLASRGLAKYQAGDEVGARADWERIAYLNKYDPNKFRFNVAVLDPALRSLKGYSTLKSMFP